MVGADHIYGSQALLLSRDALTRVVRNWKRCRGMQDIRISRLAARSGTAYYHGPSLVQHVGVQSLWAAPIIGRWTLILAGRLEALVW